MKKTLGELASLVGAELKGDPELRVGSVNALEDAEPQELSFIVHPRHLSDRPVKTKAAALIVPPSLKELDFPLLITERPYEALARVAQIFNEPPPLPARIHPTAYVGEGVHLELNVAIGPMACVESGTFIGEGTRIYGGAYVGRKVRIGCDCLIYPRVTILNGCRIGNRVVIHSGTVVGSDGFGYAQDGEGRHVKIPQMGTVRIDDDVEIGANCAVDRATFGETWIQEGVKIDNLVQIAHNVVVGKHSALAAQVGVAGSTRVGEHVMLAGQVGVSDHVEIGDGARVGAQSGVGRSIPGGEDHFGSPAIASKEWLRMYAVMRRLPALRDELRQLRERLRKLEAALG